MEKKYLHVISHTHWDREWYMPFESHRYRLVEFFDRLLETLDNDPSFKSFHLDGQAIVVEDYLEVKPQMREKIEKYIAEGRLVIGPWYILQDEYLVDGESNVRNMLIGRKVSAKYGKFCNVGYFPDAFGNIGQAPQILRGFGIDTVAFGRGVSPRKGDRLDTGEANYGKYASEVVWRSPDGSEVLGVTFLQWYNNANEIPSETKAAEARLTEIKNGATVVATTPHLLFLNGCDHQPVQTDIGQIIERVNADPEFTDVVIHSNYSDYFEAIKPYKDNFGIFVGEFSSEYSDGWSTLANTASARIYLKQMNADCENLLEKQAEPMGVFSHLFAGDSVRREYYDFVWKMLLQNHPHDSICGCSVDPVHAEMVTRFNKVEAAAKEILKSETEALSAVISTKELGTEYAATVFNPMGIASSEYVTVKLDLPEDTNVNAEDIAIFDGEKQLSRDIEDEGIVFDYILPKDRFRVPFHTRRFAVTFKAENVPALGYKSFAIRTERKEAVESELRVTKTTLTNKRLRVKIAKDGSVTVTDRKTGASYVTGIFVDTGDIGDEYIYRQSTDGVTITTEGTKAEIFEPECAETYASIMVEHFMIIPAGVDRSDNRHEDTAGNPLKNPDDCDRQTGVRVGELPLVIDAEYILREGADRLEVRTTIENLSENHRIVVITKNDIDTKTVLAEGQFDITERMIKTWEGWTNPTNPGKMTTFFGLEDEKRGLLIAGRGLCEYEVLQDGANTMSLTLHRGIDQLGDWGYFPTPEAQCLGTLEREFALLPFAQNKIDRERAVNSAYAFAAKEPTAWCGKTHEGTLPAEKALMAIKGNGFIVSALKMAEEGEGVILRVFNPYTYAGKMQLRGLEGFKAVEYVNLGEETEKRVSVRQGVTTIDIPAKKIITIKLIP